MQGSFTLSEYVESEVLKNGILWNIIKEKVLEDLIMTEEKVDKIIELLTEIRDSLIDIASSSSSTAFETSYTSSVKSVAEDILEEIKKMPE